MSSFLANLTLAYPTLGLN